MVDRGYSQKESGPTVKCAIANVRRKPVVLTPKLLQDRYAQWEPFQGQAVNAEDISGAKETDQTLDTDGDDKDTHPASEELDAPSKSGEKRKRYANSVSPQL